MSSYPKHSHAPMKSQDSLQYQHSAMDRRGSMTSTHRAAGDIVELFHNNNEQDELENRKKLNRYSHISQRSAGSYTNNTSGDEHYHSIEDILDGEDQDQEEEEDVTVVRAGSSGTVGNTSVISELDINSALNDDIDRRNSQNSQISQSTITDSFKQQQQPSLQTVLQAATTETTPLLQSTTSIKSLSLESTTFVTELQRLVTNAFPLIITFFLQYSLTLSSVLSLSHIGQTELAAVSLSAMTANITGFAVVEGASTALDTLCPQAYGRGDFRSVGVIFIRCTLLIMCCFGPIALVWWVGAPLLLNYLSNGDAELVRLAVLYLRILSFGFPGFIIFECLKKYLQAQGIFKASTFVILIAAPFNAFMNYYLVWSKHIGLGFIGAPLAIVMTNYLMAGLLVSYTVFVDGKKCLPRDITVSEVWNGNWSRLISLSSSGVVSVISEWAFFEIITLCAARLSTLELAAQSLLATISTLMFQIPFAIGMATSNRVANYIGAGDVHACKIATRAGVSLALSVGAVVATLLNILKYDIIQLFTNDEDVIVVASSVIPIVAIYQINDYLACSTGGVLRGQGKQKLAAIISLVSYYVLTLPFTYVLAFVWQWRLLGLWFGMMGAILTISVFQCWCCFTSDWVAVIEEWRLFHHESDVVSSCIGDEEQQ
ncbi:hypothetical protein WICPIJ_004031 [Wickerhamomyces pijperi]|uniref:Ethionine resistance-conferring protein 1 n=1 Tax=Wickerhamomyces pijperi TaxID=599730 RepID=A0A9P8Q8S8_WICPI|nr:hypothetical protein WICPIJ_004031 [Wickerhamomyces pijperi]